jgi:heptosyltransferase-2
MKLGVFLPNWIGDVVMATPTLRALRARWGAEAEIIGIMRPYVAEVLAGTRFLDREVYYDPRSVESSLHTWHVAARLRRLELDRVVLLTNSLRTALLAWFSGAPRRYGYARACRGLLLTEKLHPPRRAGRWTPVPAVDYYLKLAQLLDCPVESTRLELRTSSADEASADRAWRRLGIPPGQPTVLFNSGGAFGAAKHWPVEHFAALARRTVDELGRRVVVLCGPREAELAARIVELSARAEVRSLAESGERLGIGLSKAVVRRSEAMVTTDSGPRHFAAAFDIPVVTLFGPTHITFSETRFPKAIHLQEHVPCGPCQQRACPLGHHRCMRDLAPDRVYLALSDLIRRHARRAA